MSRRSIAYISGTRADYELMRGVLDSIQKHPKLELGVIATGMHLSKRYGLTVRNIEADGFSIVARVGSVAMGRSRCEMAMILGRTIVKMTNALSKVWPDIILVEGDRDEMLAGAIVGSHIGIPVAHVSGGDVSGSIDDSIRHAITKLSHIHFPGTKLSANRIRQMGEEDWRIHMVGTPGIDFRLRAIRNKSAEAMKGVRIDSKKRTILVVQHPVVNEEANAADQMEETMEAVVNEAEHHMNVVVFVPNSDAGGEAMRNVVFHYSKLPFVRVCDNIRREQFLSLMSKCSAVVGNSSSGIIEAPSFGVPVINIGSRQKNRERAGNVIDVGYDRKEISRALSVALYDREFITRCGGCKNPYRSRGVGRRIAEILARTRIDPRLMQKEFRRFE